MFKLFGFLICSVSEWEKLKKRWAEEFFKTQVAKIRPQIHISVNTGGAPGIQVSQGQEAGPIREEDKEAIMKELDRILHGEAKDDKAS